MMKLSYDFEYLLKVALDVIEKISDTDSRQSYEIICQTLAVGLKWDYAEVWLRHNNQPHLYLSDIHYCVDESMEAFSLVSQGKIFIYGEGIPGFVWKEKKPIWINNIVDHVLFQRRHEAQEACLRTCFAVPILAHDFVDAVIVFFSKKDWEIDQNVVKLMMILSSRVGLNIIKKELETTTIKYSIEANKMIDIITKIFSLRDPYTISHENHVKELALEIGRRMHMSENELEDIKYAATLHDIGKIGVPLEILSKPSKLSKEEFSLVKTHARIGYELIVDMAFSQHVKMMVLEHHERNDGSGYPDGKKKEEIYIGSQIISVCDVASAMLENRPYRSARLMSEVIQELTQFADTKYNKRIVEITLNLLEEGFIDFKTTTY